MQRINFDRAGDNDTANLDLRSTISLRSRDGIFATDTASNFTNRLTIPIMPRVIQLMDVAVTINNYTLRDTIYLEETGFPVTPVTLPPNIYSDANIAAALGAALTAASPAGNVYTVTVDTTTFSITITAVGVTWRFVQVDSSNATYYGLGVASSKIPPIATPALSFTFGAYDFRPYDILYITIDEMPNGNVTGGSDQFVFTLTCSSVNSGGIATYQLNNSDDQFWVNVMRKTFGSMHVRILDSYGQVIPLRGGSTSILLSFNRITNGRGYD